MKTFKSLFIFASIACSLVIFSGCEEVYSAGEVTVYGTVVDNITGDPLPVATVSVESYNTYDISPVSAVTGSDGTYEFTVILPRGEVKYFNARIYVEKDSYFDASGDITFTRDMNGQRIQRSFALRPYSY